MSSTTFDSCSVYASRVDYPLVKRSHIIPQMYLRNFAHGEQIAMHLVGSDRVETTSVRNVGVRSTFYRRTRADGTKIDDVEWSLAMLEGEVTPVLREVEIRWPLGRDDKAALAEFFAAQYVRGPRWRQHHEAFLEQEVEAWRAGRDEGLTRRPTDDEIEHMSKHHGSDTQTLIRMLSLIPKVKTVFASMHWTLIRFRRLALAVSDHPVVAWPLSSGPSAPSAGSYAAGLLPTLEFTAPLSSRCALLMTWLDEPDQAATVTGAQHHARTINAFVIAHADRQWLHHPAARPRMASGHLLPISTLIHPGYNAAVAEHARRRVETSRVLQPKIGSTLDKQAHMVTVKSGD